MKVRYVWLTGVFLSAAVLTSCPETGDDDEATASIPPGVNPTPTLAVPPGDLDGDGYGVEDGDCDDEDASVYPGAEEVPYDGVDQDCSGDDLTDVDGDGHAGGEGGDDCDDTDATTYPGAEEVGDGVDNDCNGEVDEGVSTVDHDGDGFSEAEGDCDDTDPTVSPAIPEVAYDGVDQDCDGADLTDIDGDGHDGGGAGDDCDDTDPSIHPGAQEVPYDGIDQDCDGADLTDVDGDGYAGGLGGSDCDDVDPNRHPGMEEIPYDGVDQDCDGVDPTDLDGDGQAAVEADGTDCNDTDPSVFAGAPETPYDGVDQDCDGADLVDFDQDGHAAEAAGGDDCDDTDINTHPGASEFADGKDNDCNGEVDENLSTTDDDGDGVSDAEGDCNDYDPSIHPGAEDVPYDGIDQDCSGLDYTDVDGDGADGGPEGPDCNDQDPTVYPGADEVPYDGIDQDCTGDDLVDVDEDGYPSVEVTDGTDCLDQDPLAYPGAAEVPYDGIDQDCDGADFTDVDGDGYDATAAGGPDCNDADADIHPSADEVCDGVDNNCDGVVDDDAVDRDTYYMDGDHDGYGDPGQEVQVCTPTDSMVTDASDCDDTTATVYPGADEVCDEADNDCDGDVDEGVQDTFYADRDGDGFGDAASPVLACSLPDGAVENADDCDDTAEAIFPGAEESCNNTDDDCDGEIDEGVQETFYQDSDGDGFGDPNNPILACLVPTGAVENDQDCDDTATTVHPGADESCNQVDDDCDGEIDEGVQDTFYQDSDGDGFGDPDATILACTAPQGYVSDASDCDDTRSETYPGATETCNEIDDDCDADIDEGVQDTFYRDLDQDGYGNPDITKLACSAPSGYVSDNTDCRDTNDSIHPGATESCNGLDDDCDGQTDEGVTSPYYRDADGDGYGDPDVLLEACSRPSNYVANQDDCDDSAASVHPGAAESCNGTDDDCDGQVDENVKTTYHLDADGDGFGDSAHTTQACSAPSGYVEDASDCNDASASVHPGAAESCNGVDDDCDGQVDENVKTTYHLDADGDGFGDSAHTTQACSAPSGYVEDASDCNDASASVHPGATESCNGVDDDCDNQTDEGVTSTFYLDADGDGFGNPDVATQACSAPSGYVTDASDCRDSNDTIYPGAPESCNGVDDDCDGQTDEGVTSTFYLDADGDGFGTGASTTQACLAPSGYVSNSRDCDDSNSSIYPGAPESCNGLDDDCDGNVDDGVGTLYYLDQDGDGYGTGSSTAVACSAPSGYVENGSDCQDLNPSIHPGATEVLNGVDDDCDGEIDDGLTYASCKQLQTYQPGAASGVYTIDPDGPGGVAAFQVYCDMTNNGGGWTLAMKVDGTKTTFYFGSNYWTNTATYNADHPNFDNIEAKLATYHTVPFTSVMIGMKDGGVVRYLAFNQSGNSLYDVIASGNYVATSLGRNAWKSLMASPSLQPNCNREGFNPYDSCFWNTDPQNGVARIRIGIISNQESDCCSPDSRIGVGGGGSYCGQDWTNSAGNEATCSADDGDRHTKAFAYVFVR